MAGFTECANEAGQYLGRPGRVTSDGVRSKLMTHLGNVLETLPTNKSKFTKVDQLNNNNCLPASALIRCAVVMRNQPSSNSNEFSSSSQTRVDRSPTAGEVNAATSPLSLSDNQRLDSLLNSDYFCPRRGRSVIVGSPKNTALDNALCLSDGHLLERLQKDWPLHQQLNVTNVTSRPNYIQDRSSPKFLPECSESLESMLLLKDGYPLAVNSLKTDVWRPW